MKKVSIAFLVVAVMCFAAYNKFRKDEVPVTKCIGLEAVLDKKRDRFNRDTVRNLVYKNEFSDPQFYSKIVHRIETCDWIKAKNMNIRKDTDGDLFALAGTPYRADALREKVAFEDKDSTFKCIVYNGIDYVVVVLSVWY